LGTSCEEREKGRTVRIGPLAYQSTRHPERKGKILATASYSGNPEWEFGNSKADNLLSKE